MQVTGEQQPDPPWTFRGFHVHYIVRGHNIAPRAVEDAINLSDEKYCSVSTTLKLGVPVTHDYEIVEEQ